MWPKTTSEVSRALRLSRSHRKVLSKASRDLALSGAILLLLSGLHTDLNSGLLNYPSYFWPAFSAQYPIPADELKARYHLPPGLTIPRIEAASLFTALRDWAIEMQKVLCVTYDDEELLAELGCWMPLTWGASWVLELPQEEVDAVVRKWNEVHMRDEELMVWRRGAAELNRRAQATAHFYSEDSESSGRS